MGGGKRPGGPKARRKAEAPFNKKLFNCEGCTRKEPQVSACRIRTYHFHLLLGVQCPREQPQKKKRRKKENKTK